jgi:hypothetical protein
MSPRVRLDRVLGRRVLANNNRPIGRIEEFRAERDGSGWIVVAFVIGEGGLWERLGLGVRLLVGRTRASGLLARWDQIDLSNPNRPRLRCAVSDLQRIE